MGRSFEPELLQIEPRSDHGTAGAPLLKCNRSASGDRGVTSDEPLPPVLMGSWTRFQHAWPPGCHSGAQPTSEVATVALARSWVSILREARLTSSAACSVHLTDAESGRRSLASYAPAPLDGQTVIRSRTTCAFFSTWLRDCSFCEGLDLGAGFSLSPGPCWTPAPAVCGLRPGQPCSCEVPRPAASASPGNLQHLQTSGSLHGELSEWGTLGAAISVLRRPAGHADGLHHHEAVLLGGRCDFGGMGWNLSQ